MVNFDPQSNLKNPKDFSFKLHQESHDIQGRQVVDVFTVNDITTNLKYNTVATAGSNGQYSTWDIDARMNFKNSMRQFMPLTNICFSDDGVFLAMAYGEDYSMGGQVA